MQSLIHLERAKAELAKAKVEVTECLLLGDAKAKVDYYSLAMDYAKKVGLRLEERNILAEIHIRWERRLGQLLTLMEKHKGAATRLHGATSLDIPKLSELGIEKTRSHRCQQIWNVPVEEFDKEIAEVKDTNKELTSAGMYRLAKKIQNEEVVEDLRQNKTPLPKDKFRTIVIDPPWEVQKIEREVRPNQVGFDYPSMSETELNEMPVEKMAYDDSFLFLWATQKYLPLAIQLVSHWGFRYSLTMVWHKSGGFQPVGMPQYNCEFVVMGRKGSLKFLDTKKFPCCFTGERRAHSRKPDEFYEMIERVSPGPRIDMFSREKHHGFKQWGNETQKFKDR